MGCSNQCNQLSLWEVFASAYPQSSDCFANNFPSRWAAKEAIIKAHKHRRVTFHDIEIHTPWKNASGSVAPIAIVKSEEGDEHPSYQEVQVSISHDGNYATATALVFEPSPTS